MASFSSTVKFASEEVIDRFLASVDVWQTIFELLPVKDRIRLEMANKRLRILMFGCWNRVTSFDAKFELMSYNPSMSKNRLAAFVAICVDRIGDGLRSLTIREMFFPMAVWSTNLCSIGEGCPHVETINFVFINFVFEDEGWTLDIRFDSFSRLKTLSIGAETILDRTIFNLASASVFLSIPACIEVIRGLTGTWEEPFKNAAQVEGFFADRPSLREVRLAGLYTHDGSKADIFRVIAERCPQLKSINYFYFDSIDFRGVISLESMKELRIPDAVFNEMEIVTICGRSPLVEVLEFRVRFSPYLDLQSAALNALGALTKLGDLCLNINTGNVLAPSLVTEFVRELARNSGASLRRLVLDYEMPLSTAAIEALANWCGKLRRVEFCVRVGEATPASIRLLIDSIVDNADWVALTGEPALQIYISILPGHDYAATADRAPLEALVAPAANLPAGVKLVIR